MDPDNWEAVKIFLRLQTQWTYSQGVRLGLNYQSVEFIFRADQVDSSRWRDLLGEIQIMESAALEALRKKEKA